jgi:hypothetical protein
MKRSRMSRRLWPSMHSKCWAYGWVFHAAKQLCLDVCSSLRVPAHMVCNGWRGGAGELCLVSICGHASHTDVFTVLRWKDVGVD